MIDKCTDCIHAIHPHQYSTDRSGWIGCRWFECGDDDCNSCPWSVIEIDCIMFPNPQTSACPLENFDE